MTTTVKTESDDSRTHVLVIGAGAIGGLFAAKLANDPAIRVTLAVRRPTESLILESGGVAREAPVNLLDSPAALGPVDWVLIATKTYDVPGLDPWLSSSALSKAKVAVAQNGVEHANRLSPWFESDRVLPVIITYGAERARPGHIIETLAGSARIPTGRLGEQFAALCSRGELNVDVVEDFASALWKKLAWNLVGNSLTTILDVPVRDFGDRLELQWLGAQLVAECRSVAATVGASLEPGLENELFEYFGSFPLNVTSSMWQDRQRGRPLEHEAISGAVVRIAAASGLKVPSTQMINHLLRVISDLVLESAESEQGVAAR